MLRLPKCDFCVHRLSDDEDKCLAYPDGIPQEIMLSDDNVECGDGYSFEDERPSFGEVKADGLLSKLLDRIGGGNG